jgi:hypothetical protein
VANIPTGGLGFLKGEKLAKVVFLPVAHPFCRGFPAVILGIFIIQAAIQTAVQITAAAGANLLPSNLALPLDGLPARVTKRHFLLYTQPKKKLGFISSEFRGKNSFSFSELLTPSFLGRFPAGSFGSVLQEDPPSAGPGADLVC